MAGRVHDHERLILSAGTQVVALDAVSAEECGVALPKGAVGVIVRSPTGLDGCYQVQFPGGAEALLARHRVTALAKYKEGRLGDGPAADSLYGRVIYRCVVGSRAYGLEHAESDTDRRGIYLPTAEMHWSLYGVPEQLENDATQEAYWELQKFLVLALKANPNVLECLYTPLVEDATPLAEELLQMRSVFLSRMVYSTYNGYVMSQFKKMQADLRNQGRVKWKHVMHLIRLLIAGIVVLREGVVPVRVDAHRDRLLAILRGEMPWEETEAWRLSLHAEFDRAFAETRLPAQPDYDRVNFFWSEPAAQRWRRNCPEGCEADGAEYFGGSNGTVPPQQTEFNHGNRSARLSPSGAASLSVVVRHDQRRASVRFPFGGFRL